MMVVKRLGYLVFALFLLAFPAGCKKNKKIDLRPDLNVANDQILANRPFVYVFGMLVKAVSDSSLQATQYAIIDKALVFLDAKKQKYTFIFQGSQGADSTWRTGTCVATVDSGFFKQGTHIRFAFQQYAEDGHYVAGSDSIICNGWLNGRWLYDNFITGGQIKKDSARVIQFAAVYQVAVSVDVMAQGVIQTVITFNGTSGGISSGGYSFSAEITKELTLYETCPWVEDGIIAFSIPAVDMPTGTIEFMAKTLCSDKIDYDFEGSIYHVRMQEHYLKD